MLLNTAPLNTATLNKATAAVTVSPSVWSARFSAVSNWAARPDKQPLWTKR